MPFPRVSGILLHPTSFPGRFGIGDLGTAAYQFIDFLTHSGQQIWQVLPLGPTGHGNSPYMSYSSMAGNHLLISPELLRDQGLLDDSDFYDLPEFPLDNVDYDAAIARKTPLLLKAAATFQAKASTEQRQHFEEFCASRAFWLNDYALFMALKGAHDGASWHQWDGAIAQRQPEAMEKWRLRLSSEIFYHKYVQYEFFRQWSAVKTYANDRGISIIGDIPIYVAHDSADVWAFPQYFHLDPETGEPALMAGVPPDYFSATGQLWGNPIYRWDAIEASHFEWWIQRFRALLEFVDLIRIDHFRGFCAYWAVNQGETTAMNGEWVDAPGVAFFNTLKQELGSLPILAEDLGVITPDVEALRDQFEFPGMKVLQFAFGSDNDNPFLPFNYVRNSVVYTGTHDNDTTQGWFTTLADYERDRFLNYLGCTSADGIHWDLIRLALSSISNQALIPLQDVLGLGTDARMNYPGKADGNWSWRYRPEALFSGHSDRLRHLTTLYGRAPKPKAHKPEH
ncbi:MAG: 4-alpha-glucanotransferase [Oculatellaceae cyanobacterium bins.114]|nr:4-alpha-glucanotransferase [Oculatellaceae cyanobacterium bins.114]